MEMHFGETGYRLYVEKVAYKPVQAHIHYRVRKGSEDAIDGKKFPGEVSGSVILSRENPVLLHDF